MLNRSRYQSYINYIERYKQASNAATGSEVDSNANVECKNVTTLTGELYKEDGIGINRLQMYDKVKELYGEELAERYISGLTSHLFYRHDETNPLLPYCVSITMYPFLIDGLKSIGGGSTAPKNLDSFCGSFINLCFAIAAQFAGAVSTPEFITYMDYFIKKEYGEDYYLHSDKVVVMSVKTKTIDKVITDKFEQIVYSLNQPAAARSFQSIFWNIAYFDNPYFNGMFEDFVFPDMTIPKWDSINWLQKRFMKWLNKERTRAIVTFPVETVNMLDDGNDYVDREWKHFVAEMLAEGHSFFIYRSDSVDSLASCCRLKNEMQDNTFSFTLGAGGVSTGSKGVITLNLNRFIQEILPDKKLNKSVLVNELTNQINDIHKYLLTYNEILKSLKNSGLLTVFDAGFIALEKEYLTIGINGFIEGAEFLGIEPTIHDPKYQEYCETICKTIYTINKRNKTYEAMFNTEFVPAENLGVKNAQWDRRDGYEVPRDCYNSYFYRVEDEYSPIDKFILHGEQFTKYLDGGSALHLNLNEHLSKEQYLKLLDVAVKTKCPYWTINVPNTICNECGNITKHNLKTCPVCGSNNVDYATRVIGYLKRVSNFSEDRQKEEKDRHYHTTTNIYTDA